MAYHLIWVHALSRDMRIKIWNIVGIGLLFFYFCPSAFAEALTYRYTLKSAIDNSYDLKMSAFDIDISKAELKEAKSELYPVLSTQVNTEHNDGLGNSNGVGYAGTSIISTFNQYRNMAYLSLSYNLFDFGAVAKKVQIAKKGVEQKKVAYELQLKDIKLKVLDSYSKALQCSDEIKTKQQILTVYEQMFNAKERLFVAGTADKISVMDEAVKIARTQDDIQNSKLAFKNALSDLSLLTQQKYNSDNLEVLDFDEINLESGFVPVNNHEPIKVGINENAEGDFSFDPEQTLESKFYDYEIEKKKAELEVYKRQRFPSFKFYTNYGFYGQDADKYFASLGDVKKKSLTIGVSGQFVFFDGFKNKASKEKAALEIRRLEVEKEKKLNTLQAEYEKTFDSYETYKKELVIKKEMLKTVNEKLVAVDRMSRNGLVGSNEILSAKADLLMQEYNLQKNITDISSQIKKIQIMTGKDI